MILSLNTFSFEYSPGKIALKVPHLRIEAGEKVALVGRNGSGKSTLLHCLAGVHTSRDGARTCQASPEKISLVFQTPCLDKKLTIRENLVLFGKVWGLSKKTLQSNLNKLEEVLGLKDLMDCEVSKLSGGQQRRADLARALLPEPALLFLDEPTTGLDVMSRREFWSVLARAKQAKPELTLICASHHSAELELFDRVVFLHNGQITLDAMRSDLVSELPAETLEIKAYDSERLMRALVSKKHSLQLTEVMHNQLLLHTTDAAVALSQLKNDSDLVQLIESTTVRKTSLADVVWQKLTSFSQANSGSNLVHESLLGANQ